MRYISSNYHPGNTFQRLFGDYHKSTMFSSTFRTAPCPKDSKLLVDMAHGGFGVYSFIPDAGFVGTIFVNYISSLGH